MRMRCTILLIALALVSVSGQQRSELDEVAALAGEPRQLARRVSRVLAAPDDLENGSPFANAPQRRLVIVADDERAGPGDARGDQVVQDTGAARTTRPMARQRPVAGPCERCHARATASVSTGGGFFDHPEAPESRYAWRWVTYQAPDLVLQLRGGDVLTRGDGPGIAVLGACPPAFRRSARCPRSLRWFARPMDRPCWSRS